MLVQLCPADLWGSVHVVSLFSLNWIISFTLSSSSPILCVIFNLLLSPSSDFSSYSIFQLQNFHLVLFYNFTLLTSSIWWVTVLILAFNYLNVISLSLWYVYISCFESDNWPLLAAYDKVWWEICYRENCTVCKEFGWNIEGLRLTRLENKSIPHLLSLKPMRFSKWELPSGKISDQGCGCKFLLRPLKF